MKCTPVVQLVDRESVSEFLGKADLSKTEVERFESDMRLNALCDGEKPPIYAGVVAISRHYGGPEEGGMVL